MLHAGGALPDVLQGWEFDPIALLAMGAAGTLYAIGLGRLWAEAGRGRVVTRRQAGCYAAGIAAAAVALVSPLGALGETVFWGHMVQHLVLVVVAAPLLALGAPLLPWLWVLRPSSRRAVGAWWHEARALPALAALMTTPLVAWLLHAGVLWAWHLPAAYQAALGDERLHALEHASFLGTACLFWWVVLQPAGRRRLSHGMAVLYVVTAGMQGGLLGALLTFAGRPFYPVQSAGAAEWGLSALGDQQLAGLIMWLPAGLAYLAVAGTLFVLWLHAEEVRMRRLESL